MVVRWSVDQTIRAAEGLAPLAAQHRRALEARLPAGFIDGLAADSRRLLELTGGKSAAHSQRSTATVTQNDAVKRGMELVSHLRRLVRTGAPRNKALHRSVGVGKEVANTVGAVARALEVVVTGASAAEAEARAAGILPDDVALARSLWASLADADRAQEGLKLTAREATAASKTLQRRLEDDLMHLVSVASVTLGKPEAAAFDALTPAVGRAKKKKPVA